MPFSVFHCIIKYFCTFLSISLHFFTFLSISLDFFPFHCIFLLFVSFQCFSPHFSSFLCIFLYFSGFLCIFLRITFKVLRQLYVAYCCPINAFFYCWKSRKGKINISIGNSFMRSSCCNTREKPTHLVLLVPYRASLVEFTREMQVEELARVR